MTIPTSARIPVEKDIVNDMAKQSSYAKHASQNQNNYNWISNQQQQQQQFYPAAEIKLT